MPNEFVARNGIIALNNTQITGSLSATNGFTGSLLGTAATASYVENAQTASYVLNGISSSFALTASYAINAGTAQLALNAYTADTAFSSSYAVTSSYALQATSASYALTSSYVLQAISASYALTSSYPINVTGSTLYSTNPIAGAANTTNSIFLGSNAGLSATSANNSNFLGNAAGASATSANNSNFFGVSAGQSGTAANNSNFFGTSAGFLAVSANNSNFFGNAAGRSASSASFSTLIGYQAGRNFGASSLGIKSNNIVIGTNITLPDGATNAINLGAIIFATGSYSTVAGNPFSGSMTSGMVGINKAFPIYTLDVSGSGNYSNGLIVTGSINATDDIIAYSTSDLRFKINVIPISDALAKLDQINGVEFDWLESSEYHSFKGRDIGVIAQEIEKVLPEIVTTKSSGYKAVKYEKIIPLLIEAVKAQQKEITKLKETINSIK